MEVAGLHVEDLHQSDEGPDGQGLDSGLDLLKHLVKLYLLVGDHVLARVVDEPGLDVGRVDAGEVLVDFSRLELHYDDRYLVDEVGAVAEDRLQLGDVVHD